MTTPVYRLSGASREDPDDHRSNRRAALMAARKPRRRQEDRSAETRTKVVRAAMECVAELGFRGATMSAIADRAGVTWGAIQHQFGEKDAIFDAVMEAVLSELEREFSRLPQSAPDIPARVRAFVRKAGELLRGPSYRAFVEIQLNRARDERRDSVVERKWGRHVADSLGRTWGQAFAGLGIPARAMLAGQHFGYMVLSGIAAEAMLFPAVDFSKQHLRALEESLLRMYAKQ